jgi:CRISPR system Cascade subunit CasB
MTTTKTEKSPQLERAEKFFTSLRLRIDKDSGAKAELKRALSGEERHIRNTYALVLPYLGEVKEWQQDVWILVAALSAYYPQEIRTEQRNFGSIAILFDSPVY